MSGGFRIVSDTLVSYTVALDLPLRKLNCSLFFSLLSLSLLFGVFTGAWLSVP